MRQQPTANQSGGRLISIHAPQWGATFDWRQFIPPVRFQSTHPSGVRRWTPARSYRRTYFNPRTPVGCDVRIVTAHSGPSIFQSTHPSGVRQDFDNSFDSWMQFQSTHPSGVRRHVRVASKSIKSISIHAPQWGATVDSRRFRVQYGRFQSTHPSGVRHEAGEVVVLGGGISIHAPQWGATAEVKPLTVAVTNFNPRTPVGCDLSPPLIRRCRRYFNPRTPVGCDLRLTEQRERTITYFNPRTPVGCDCSISAGRSRFGYFNPRTPVGCDHVRLQAIGTACRFQSTHPSGVRQHYESDLYPTLRFQSTHPSGVRPI